MKNIFSISLIFFLTQLAFADDYPYKAFTSDGTIQDGEEWWNIDIYDTPPNHTTVAMTGGSVHDSMSVHDASTFNMSAGNVAGLGALGQTTVNFTGGSVGGLSIFDNATANISDNANVYTANALSSGTINMNGGTVSCLGANENSVINLRGGVITDYLGANSYALVNIYGTNLAKTSIGGSHGAGQVTGFWQNGLPFVVNLADNGVYSHINLIPEPVTLVLLGIGIFFLQRAD